MKQITTILTIQLWRNGRMQEPAQVIQNWKLTRGTDVDSLDKAQLIEDGIALILKSPQLAEKRYTRENVFVTDFKIV